MDAVKFIKERRRMYAGGFITKAICDINTKAEDVVAEVEEWAREHPRKTRQSEFLKLWHEAEISGDTGALTVCPAQLLAKYRGAEDGGCLSEAFRCDDCLREFWMEEVE